MVGRKVLLDSGFEILDAGACPAFDVTLTNQGEAAFDEIEPRRRRGYEMQVVRSRWANQARTVSVLWMP